MLKKLSVFGASLMVTALFVGCGTSTPPSNTDVADRDTGRMEENMEDDSMMEDDSAMEDDSMMEDDSAMEDDSMMEDDSTMEDDSMMEDDSTMEDDSMMEDDAMEDDDVAMEEEVKEFTIDGENFSFSPSEMVVNEGDTVRVTFNNVGGMHDFVIDEFDAQTSIINTGETETIEFVADKTGTFEYYCSVGSHREMGMVGTLTVE